MRYGVLFQALSICVMLFQSFFAARYIGLSSFGSQMLLIAPAFLAQALVETAIQAELNTGGRQGQITINLGHMAASAAIGSGVFVIAIVLSGIAFNVLVMCFAVVYLYYAATMGIVFATRDLRAAAFSCAALFMAYVSAFFVADLLLGHSQIVLANLLGFAFGAVIATLSLLRKTRIVFVWEKPSIAGLVAGFSFRLPVVAFSSVSTMVLGAIGAAPHRIGEFRVFVSALNAGRYFNPVPVAQIQKSIEDWARDSAVPDGFKLGKIYIVATVGYGVLLVALFPTAYSWVFGTPTFTRPETGLAVGFLLLQPISYAAMAFARTRGRNSAVPSIICAAAMLAIFYFAVIMGYEPFFAMGLSSTIAAVFLCAAAAFYARIRP